MTFMWSPGGKPTRRWLVLVNRGATAVSGRAVSRAVFEGAARCSSGRQGQRDAEQRHRDDFHRAGEAEYSSGTK
jgi:hypothetical protein